MARLPLEKPPGERFTEEPDEREGENEWLGEEECLLGVFPKLRVVPAPGFLVTVVRVELSRVGVWRVFLFTLEPGSRLFPNLCVPVLDGLLSCLLPMLLPFLLSLMSWFLFPAFQFLLPLFRGRLSKPLR